MSWMKTWLHTALESNIIRMLSNFPLKKMKRCINMPLINIIELSETKLIGLIAVGLCRNLVTSKLKKPGPTLMRCTKIPRTRMKSSNLRLMTTLKRSEINTNTRIRLGQNFKQLKEKNSIMHSLVKFKRCNFKLSVIRKDKKTLTNALLNTLPKTLWDLTMHMHSKIRIPRISKKRWDQSRNATRIRLMLGIGFYIRRMLSTWRCVRRISSVPWTQMRTSISSDTASSNNKTISTRLSTWNTLSTPKCFLNSIIWFSQPKLQQGQSSS